MTFAYCCVMGLNYRITSPHSTFCWVAQTIFQTCRQTVDFDFWLDEISTLAGNFSVWWRGKHTHNICISMGNHPILVCGFQWLFDVQPYFWDELPQKKGFSTVFSWDIFGRGRDMVFLYHNPLDSDGQLGRFQLEQISQTLGSWWQPVISGTRVSPCSKMFKVLSARVCRNFRPFFLWIWTCLKWSPVKSSFFWWSKWSKKLAPASPLKKMWLISCQGRDYRRLRKAPEAPLADPHAAKHTTILWWFTIRLIGGLMKHTIKIWPDGRIANFFFSQFRKGFSLRAQFMGLEYVTIQWPTVWHVCLSQYGVQDN